MSIPKKKLTEAGLTKTLLSSPSNEKMCLYSFPNQALETITKVQETLQHKLKNGKEYEGDINRLNQEIAANPYLLKQGKHFKLISEKKMLQLSNSSFYTVQLKQDSPQEIVNEIKNSEEKIAVHSAQPMGLGPNEDDLSTVIIHWITALGQDLIPEELLKTLFRNLYPKRAFQDLTNALDDLIKLSMLNCDATSSSSIKYYSMEPQLQEGLYEGLLDEQRQEICTLLWREIKNQLEERMKNRVRYDKSFYLYLIHAMNLLKKEPVKYLLNGAQRKEFILLLNQFFDEETIYQNALSQLKITLKEQELICNLVDWMSILGKEVIPEKLLKALFKSLYPTRSFEEMKDALDELATASVLQYDLDLNGYQINRDFQENYYNKTAVKDLQYLGIVVWKGIRIQLNELAHHQVGNEKEFHLYLTHAIALLGWDSFQLVLNDAQKDASLFPLNHNPLSQLPQISEYHLGTRKDGLDVYSQKLQEYEALLITAQASGNFEEEQKIHYELGNLYSSLKRHLEALSYYENGMQIASILKDAEMEGLFCRALGLTYRMLSDYNQAEVYHKKSLTIALELKDPISEGIAYGNLGNICSIQEKYAEAIDYYEKSLKMSKAFNSLVEEGTNYSNIGTTYILLKQYHKARESYEKALNIANQLKDLASQRRLYKELGKTYAFLEDHHQAIDYYQRALAIMEIFNDEVGQQEVYGHLGKAYSSLRKYDKAVKYCKMRLKMALKFNDKDIEISSYGYLADAYESLEKYEEAIKCHEKILEIFLGLKHHTKLDTVYNNISNIYTFLGKYDNAIKFGEKALEIANQLDHKIEQVRSYSNLGIAYRYQGEYPKAIKCHTVSLRIAQETGDRKGEGAAYGNLGISHLALGDNTTALECHHKHLEISHELRDRSKEALIYGNLGNVYRDLGEYGKSIECYQQAVDIAREFGLRKTLGSNYHNLGNTYLILGNIPSAIECEEKSLEIARETNDHSVIELATDGLRKAHEFLEKCHQAEKFLSTNIQVEANLQQDVKDSHRISKENINPSNEDISLNPSLLKEENVIDLQKDSVYPLVTSVSPDENNEFLKLIDDVTNWISVLGKEPIPEELLKALFQSSYPKHSPMSFTHVLEELIEDSILQYHPFSSQNCKFYQIDSEMQDIFYSKLSNSEKKEMCLIVWNEVWPRLNQMIQNLEQYKKLSALYIVHSESLISKDPFKFIFHGAQGDEILLILTQLLNDEEFCQNVIPPLNQSVASQPLNETLINWISVLGREPIPESFLTILFQKSYPENLLPDFPNALKQLIESSILTDCPSISKIKCYQIDSLAQEKYYNELTKQQQKETCITVWQGIKSQLNSLIKEKKYYEDNFDVYFSHVASLLSKEHFKLSLNETQKNDIKFKLSQIKEISYSDDQEDLSDCDNEPYSLEQQYQLVNLELQNLEEAAVASGNQGNTFASLGKYHQAEKSYQHCLEIAQKIQDRQLEGNAHSGLGMTYFHLKNYRKAIEHHEKHLNITIKLGLQQDKGKAYSDLGMAYDGLGQYNEAIQFHEKHLIIAQDFKDKKGEGNAYGNLGNAHRGLGKYKKALEYHIKHLTIALDLQDKVGKLRAYCNSGTAHFGLGQHQEAIKCHTEHLIIAQELQDKLSEGSAYGGLGNAYHALGEYKKAIEFHEKHLIIAQELQNEALAGSIYSGLANAYHFLGEPLRAIEFHKKHLEISQNLKDQVSEGLAHNNLGNAYYSLKNYVEAIKYHEEALTISSKLHDQVGKSRAYGNLGIAYVGLGKYDKAIELYEKRLEITIKLKDKVGEGMVYANLGNAYANLKLYETAIQFHKKNLQIALDCGGRVEKGLAYINLGVIYADLNNFREAEEHLYKGIEIADSLQQDAKDAQWQITIFERWSTAYIELEKVLLLQHKNREALEISDRRRSRALASLISKKFPGQEDRSSLQTSLTFQKMQELARKFHTTFIVYSLVSSDKKASSIQAWIICSKKESLSSISLSIPSDTFSQKDQIFKTFPYQSDSKRPVRGEEKQPNQIFNEKLSSWYDLFIAPLESYIPSQDSGETLTFIPEGFLTHLPFGAFYHVEKKQYLIEKYPISIAPSIQVLSLLDQLPKGSFNQALLMGNPTTLVEKENNLTHSESEVRKIIAPLMQVSDEDVFTQKRATVENVFKYAPNAKWIHFACHGLAGQKPIEKPDHHSVFEGLFKLAVDDNHPMGHLHAKEAALMILKADLVFMSACHLGRGNLQKEGSIGPIWSFLGAGARSTIASYWPLPEGDMTVKMVDTFYRHYLGIKTPKLNKAKALQQAILMAIKTEKDKPRQWGAFFLAGLIE